MCHHVAADTVYQLAAGPTYFTMETDDDGCYWWTRELRCDMEQSTRDDLEDRWNTDASCSDVDECSSTDNPCGETCTNVPGEKQMCLCRRIFVLVSSRDDFMSTACRTFACIIDQVSSLQCRKVRPHSHRFFVQMLIFCIFLQGAFTAQPAGVVGTRLSLLSCQPNHKHAHCLCAAEVWQVAFFFYMHARLEL